MRIHLWATRGSRRNKSQILFFLLCFTSRRFLSSPLSLIRAVVVFVRVDAGGRSPIGLPPIPHPHHNPVVLQLADDAPVPYAVLPGVAEFAACQRLSGIVGVGESA